jgi:hypothetical protein
MRSPQQYRFDPSRSVGEGDSLAFLRRKLNHFARYTSGWAFGEGREFSQLTIRNAGQLLEAGINSAFGDAVDVFPGRHGQVIVSFYRGNESLDYAVLGDIVEVSCDGSADSEQEEDRTLTLAEAIGEVLGVRTKWPLYEYFTPTSSTGIANVSRVRPSSPPQMGVAFPFLTKSALVVPPETPARMPFAFMGP